MKTIIFSYFIHTVLTFLTASAEDCDGLDYNDCIDSHTCFYDTRRDMCSDPGHPHNPEPCEEQNYYECQDVRTCFYDDRREMCADWDHPHNENRCTDLGTRECGNTDGCNLICVNADPEPEPRCSDMNYHECQQNLLRCRYSWSRHACVDE